MSSGSSQSSVDKTDRSTVTPRFGGHDNVLCDLFRGASSPNGCEQESSPGKLPRTLGPGHEECESAERGRERGTLGMEVKVVNWVLPRDLALPSKRSV